MLRRNGNRTYAITIIFIYDIQTDQPFSGQDCRALNSGTNSFAEQIITYTNATLHPSTANLRPIH